MDYLTHWIEFHSAVRRSSPHTLKSYNITAQQYRQFLKSRHRSILTATFADTVAFATHLSQNGNCAATIRVKLAAVRSLHSFLQAAGARADNPAALVTAPRPRDRDRTRAYKKHPTADCETVRANLKTTAQRCAFALMYDLALRCSSAASILRENIDPAAWTVTVIQKGGNLHRLPVYSETARRAIWTQLDEITARKTFLLPGNRPGTHLSTGTLNRWIHEAAARAGFDPREWSPHALRHSMAETLRATGRLDAFQLQNYLGHQNLETTKTYTTADLPNALIDYLTDPQTATK